jgi:multisubunit Na+/H+ antiporter MnhC subunit
MINADMTTLFWLFMTFTGLIVICGIYCFLVTFNLLRMLIGIEVMIKGVTLLIIVAGYLSGQMALAQSIVITVIVIEVVVMVVAAGIILGFFNMYDSLNVKNAKRLKG